MSLTSKERMHLAVNYKEADRVPLHVFFVPEMDRLLRKKYKKKLGEISKNIEDKWQGLSVMDILFGHDIVFLNYGLNTGPYGETKSDTYVDEWGIVRKKVYYKALNGDGYYTEIVNSPLEDDSKIDSYVPPNPDDEDMGYAKKIIKKYGDEYYICGIIGCSTYEALKFLRGFEKSLVDLIANKDIAHRIMNMSVDYHLKLGEKLIDLGVDMLNLSDDLSSEHSLLMSPESFREMIKPKLGYMINELKKKSKDVKISFHCCGYVEPIIDDFIEVGVDLLNPIQPESMDPAYIKKRFGKRIGLWGGVSSQHTLPFKSPKEVEAEVKEVIRTCAPGGGFVISPSHNLQLDVPLENIEAFYNAVKKYGKYPVRL